jgi:hypothetical protein
LALRVTIGVIQRMITARRSRALVNGRGSTSDPAPQLALRLLPEKAHLFEIRSATPRSQLRLWPQTSQTTGRTGARWRVLRRVLERNLPTFQAKVQSIHARTTQATSISIQFASQSWSLMMLPSCPPTHRPEVV